MAHRWPAVRQRGFATDAGQTSNDASPKELGEAYFTAGFELWENGISLSEAIDLFAKSAQEGNANGNFFLALAYQGQLTDEMGRSLVGLNPEAAARCYNRAALAGDQRAMFNLSFCYRGGDGVERDVPTAFDWLEKSAAAGSDRAQYNLGIALDPTHPTWGKTEAGGEQETPIIAKDANRAVICYRQAVEQGHEKARVNLGISMYSGAGCKVDREAAIAFWRIAADGGEQKAVDCLLEAAEAGSALAERHLVEIRATEGS